MLTYYTVKNYSTHLTKEKDIIYLKVNKPNLKNTNVNSYLVDEQDQIITNKTENEFFHHP